MRTSPRRTTRIDNALPQKKFRQAMSASHQIPASILTGTDQISGCLLFYRRDRDLDDLVQSEQPRQMQRVASIFSELKMILQFEGWNLVRRVQ